MRELELLNLTLDDDALQVLPRLPALTHLHFSGTRTFGDRGIQAIAACKGLKSLGLRGSSQLQPDSIARLGALTNLETLDLGEAGGLTDRALSALQTLTGLRTLVLGKGLTGEALRALEGMRRLQSLALSENGGLDSSALLHVPTTVVELFLDHCSGMGASAATLLRDRFPGLRELWIARCGWVDDTALAAILQLPKLEGLILTGCQEPTAQSFAAIAGARSLRQLEVSQCPWFTAEMLQQLRQDRPELRVTR